ncbi:MAG: TetR/AcrR family transcriptional regulator C-terminal domain-containing protein [Nocardioidaceae bacterium]|nr:TetR/AcrR family transcriptional regulator C-terminal domain-containing protein [Nocardioidaceae bacterium]MDQ3325432.1 TetR/AcrR family transcriptional regulator C-terminal domain-containing protein [Actinomycetota bacterium]
MPLIGPDDQPSLDADTAVVDGREVPSERVPLDRSRIVAAGIDYVDSHGLTGLTMRRLGADLGVEAMSLYRYISGRDELLAAIVEHVIAEVEQDPDMVVAPEHGWQDFVQRLAHGFRRVALAHPHIFPLVASHPTEAPWIRPPVRSLKFVELFLDGLHREGFSDEMAVAAYRAFTSFLLGHLLLEVSTMGAAVGPMDLVDPPSGSTPGLDNYPNVARLSDALSEDHSVTEFEESLEQLLDRLAEVLAATDG